MGIPGSKKHKVQVSFSLENAAFLRGMREVSAGIEKARRNAHENYAALSNSLENMNRNILIGLGAITGAIAAIGAVAIKTAGEFELLQVQFETLSGSAEDAAKLIKEMKEFAAKTPLEVRDIQQAAVMMLGFGYSIDEVIPKLKLFGEAAITMRVPMEQIIRVREFLLSGQFRSIMLAPLGISRPEMEAAGAAFGPRGDLISSAEDAVAAFDKILSERFGGLFDKVQGIVIQRMINIGDQIALIFDQIGRSLRPVIVPILQWLEDTFNRFRKWLENNSSAVEAAGRAIADTFMSVFQPFMDGITRFLDKLHDDPGIIARVAGNIMLFVKALTGLLIISSVIVLIIKFVTMIGILNLALGGLGITLGALSPILWPLIIVIGGLLILLGALEIAHVKGMEAERRRKENVEKYLVTLKEMKKDIGDINEGFAELNESTEEHGKKIRELKDKIVELIKEYPELRKEMGLVETESDDLVTVGGEVIDTYGELQELWNDFDSSRIIEEIDKVSDALMTNATAFAQNYADMLAMVQGPETYAETLERMKGDKEAALAELMRISDEAREIVLAKMAEDKVAEDGGRRPRAGKVTDEIDKISDRLKRWNSIIDNLTESGRKRNIAIEHGLKTRAEADAEFNAAMLRAVEGMLLLNAEQALRLDHETFMNYLLENEVIPNLEELVDELTPWGKLINEITEAEKNRVIGERMVALGLADINDVNENYRSAIVQIIESMIRLDEAVGLTADQMTKLGELIQIAQGPTWQQQLWGAGGMRPLSIGGRGQVGLDLPETDTESLWEKISKKWNEFWSTFADKFEEEINAVEGSLMRGFRNLGRAIVSGDIGKALASLFNDLGNTIGQLAESAITSAIGGGGMFGGLIGALGGGLISGAISMIASLFTEKTPGVSMSQPSYVFVTNWEDFYQFGATMPVSYVMSGRSEQYGTDPHGRLVLDLTYTGWENQEHFDE